MRKGGEWHKNYSQGIVPLALSKYFLEDAPVEETIKNHTNIYDFCKTFSVKGNFIGETYELDENGLEINHTKTSKTNRYYLSNDGIKFRKRGEPLAPKWDKRLKFETEQDEEEFKNLKVLVNKELDSVIEKGEIENSKQAILNITCSITEYKLFHKYYKYLNYIFGSSRVEYSKGESFKVEAKKDWRLIDIEAGDNFITLFNKYEKLPIEEYGIDYDYYINECKKVIDTITGEKERLIAEKRQEKEQEKINRERTKYIESCVNKQCTERIYNELRKSWMDGIFPVVTEFKKSPVRKSKEIIELVENE